MPNPGSGHVADLTSLQRDYSKLDRAIMQARRVAPMTAIARAKMKTRKVTDPKPSDLEDREPVMSFTAYGNDSGAGTATDMAATDAYIYIASASTRLKPYDLLKFDGYDANNSNTSKLASGEVMMVLATPATNTVQVQRNVQATGTTTYNITTSAAGNGVTCQLIGSALPEDSTSRVPKIPALIEKYNYIQIFETPMSISDVNAMTKSTGPDEMTRRAQYAFVEHLRGIEGALLHGHRGTLSVNGTTAYLTGGVSWHLDYTDSDNGTNAWSSTYDLVTGDGTSRIWRPGADFSRDTWEEYITKAFRKGNNVKVGFHGEDFLRQLQSEYRGQVIYEKETTDFGLTVNRHSMNGKEIQFVYDPEMDAIGPRDLYLLDMDFVELAVMKDTYRRRNIQANDALGKKDDWVSYVGLLMHFQEAHSAVMGMDDIV